MKIKENKNLERLKRLFWDYNFNDVISNFDNDVVIERILELGDIEDFLILKERVPKDKIISFLKRKGEKCLSKLSFNFWKTYYGIK